MISLLFLTFNRRPMTMRCFRSLLPTLTNRADTEWIILDNASSDGTAQWLRVFASDMNKGLGGERVKLILSAENLGVGGGRTRLLEASAGDVLIFLDSDVVAVDPNWLQRLLNALQTPGVMIAGPGGHQIVTSPAGWVWFAPKGKQPGEADVVSGYCQAFPREVLKTGVAFDPAYGRYWHEDSDWCLQIRAAGGKVWHTGNIGLQHIFAGSGDDGTGMEKFHYLASKWAGKGLIAAEGGK